MTLPAPSNTKTPTRRMSCRGAVARPESVGFKTEKLVGGVRRKVYVPSRAAAGLAGLLESLALTGGAIAMAARAINARNEDLFIVLALSCQQLLWLCARRLIQVKRSAVSDDLSRQRFDRWRSRNLLHHVRAIVHGDC